MRLSKLMEDTEALASGSAMRTTAPSRTASSTHDGKAETTPRGSVSAAGATERWTLKASPRGSGFSSRETVERLLGRKTNFVE